MAAAKCDSRHVTDGPGAEEQRAGVMVAHGYLNCNGLALQIAYLG